MTGFYNRFTGDLVATTVYADAHEHAHQSQNARQTLIWRVWLATERWPMVGALALLAVEVEASAIAVIELHEHGILTAADISEAMSGLRTYGVP